MTKEAIAKLLEQMPEVGEAEIASLFPDVFDGSLSAFQYDTQMKPYKEVAQAQQEADARWIVEQEAEELQRLGVKTESLEAHTQKRHKLLDEYAKQQGLVKLPSEEELQVYLGYFSPSTIKELLRWLQERK